MLRAGDRDTVCRRLDLVQCVSYRVSDIRRLQHRNIVAVVPCGDQRVRTDHFLDAECRASLFGSDELRLIAALPAASDVKAVAVFRLKVRAYLGKLRRLVPHDDLLHGFGDLLHRYNAPVVLDRLLKPLREDQQVLPHRVEEHALHPGQVQRIAHKVDHQRTWSLSDKQEALLLGCASVFRDHTSVQRDHRAAWPKLILIVTKKSDLSSRGGAEDAALLLKIRDRIAVLLRDPCLMRHRSVKIRAKQISVKKSHVSFYPFAFSMMSRLRSSTIRAIACSVQATVTRSAAALTSSCAFSTAYPISAAFSIGISLP